MRADKMCYADIFYVHFSLLYWYGILEIDTIEFNY